MQKHLFIIIVVSATVVVGGGLLYWGYSVGESIKTESMSSRNELSKELTALQRGTPVNPRTIDDEQKWREGILESLTQVTEENVAWNHRFYTVPKLLTAAAQGQEPELLPALPYNKDRWEDNEWAFQYVQAYHKTLDRLVKELNATTMPTNAEVFNEAVIQQEDLNRIKEAQAKQDSLRDPDATPAGNVGRRREATSPYASRFAEIRILDNRKARDGGAKPTLSEQAIHQAFEKIRVEQTLRGSIYATNDSFDIPFERGEIPREMSPYQVWNTWLGLCVQTDITKAITKTNRVRKGNTVLVAPVKRLVWVKIDEEVPVVKPGGMSRERERDRDRDERERYGERESSRGGDRDQPEGSLTERETSSVYTVVKYRFSVIMRTRDLPLLMDELLKTNYHVVVNQRIAGPEDDLQTMGAAGEARPGAAGKKKKRDYYYGPEPVRQVMLECQLILLNGWARGTYVPGSGKSPGHWDPTLPPLMPKDVLWAVPKTSRRPEDTGRLNKKKAYAWPNTAAAKEMSSDG